jgi:GNAT superfamily N-acetyltransferase
MRSRCGTFDAIECVMNTTSTIRIGTTADVPAVQRLIRDRSDGENKELPSLPTIPGHRYLLVLDAPDGGLAAAAQVTLEGERGHLGLLIVDQQFQGEGLEHRLIGVAEALCDAFGCESLDIPARRRAA